ncbi:MAG: zinc-dependent metalloprotease, partial [Solirubrobacterales bacterium]|nr:zinc-dependent metalloprotease [Solirubrobacterales bacterium]
TSLTPLAPVPAAEPVDRAAWIETALAGMRGLLEPVVERIGTDLGPVGMPLRAAGGAVLALEVGAISGILAQRVLGQYEFSVLDPAAPARLLFVTPNLAHAAGKLEASPGDLLRWVSLHEVTHALQFGGVPWLRADLADRVRNLLAALEMKVDGRRLKKMPSVTDLRGIVEAFKAGELATLALGEGQRAQLESMQAFMALLEGYAEHVMDVVGAELLPDLPGLRAAMDRRRHERTGMLRLLEKLIGLDMKMRQYELGKAFCDAVVAHGGIGRLNRVWEAPERVPTPAELVDPAAWIARTEPTELVA